MKVKNVFILTGLMLMVLTVSSFTPENVTPSEIENYQEGFVVYASFDGKKDNGYNFLTKGKDGKSHTITFQQVKASVISAFDLNSDAYIETKFKVTFNKEQKKLKGKDGIDKEDEINTITKLEKL